MRLARLFSILAPAILAIAHASAQTPVFTDTFENGVPANGEVIPAFWTLSAPANTTVVETGGVLVTTAGGAASPNGTLAPLVRSSAPSAQFNFFKQQLRFAAAVSLAGTAPVGQRIMRFALTGSAVGNYTAEDALAVQLRADNSVYLSRKQDRPSTTPESGTVLVNNANVGSTITGFELTLDALNYTLVVTHTGGAGSTSFTGAHGLIAAQWGVDGDSAFQFETLRATGASAGAGLDAVSTVDNFTITRLSPPGLFEDTFGNGIAADSDSAPGFWTATLPQTSTLSENGRLVQNASSAATGNVTASSGGALSASFNFFDQQLKFGAELTMSGTAAASSSRGQFVLASAAGTGFASPDTLMVGFRPQNSIAFNRKIDGPNVEPDQNNHTSVGEPLGTTAGGNGTVGFSGTDLLNRFDLVLNGSRYRLRGFNGGKGSGILRFSGAHGIDRTKWGANGDSALLLEAFRTGAAAGTTATASWDNVKVETDATTLLAEPYWDFSATYATSTAVPPSTTTAAYTLWLPTTEPVIRGVILIGPGSGEDFRYMVHDPVAQEAARAMGFALLGYQNAGNMNFWSGNSALIQPAVQAVLDQAATVSGRPELKNAPLCITGLSAGGFDSTFLAQYWPERTISFVAHRGAGFSSVTSLSEAAKKVPGFMVAGSTDTNGSTDPFILKQRFSAWHSLGGQIAYAVDWRVGHTPRGNQGWEATFAWFAEIAALRYPRPMLPSVTPGAGAPTLINLSDDSGWLGETADFSAATTPSVTQTFATISPYASYSAGPITSASWLANETCAKIYRALSSTDLVVRTVVPLQGPLRIVSPAQYADPITTGQSVTIELDPREFDNTNALVSVEFHDGATLLGTDTTGPEWSQTFTPATPGLHTLTLVATDTLGGKRAALRVLHVVPADFPPVGFTQAHTFSGNNTFSGTVTGQDPEGGAVTFTIVSGPAHGQLLSFDPATGTFTYQADAGYSGADGFTFATVSGGVTGPASSVSFNVTPSEAAGILGFAATTMKVSKTADLATLTVNRTAGSTGAVSVSYATSDSSATAGAHYTAASGTLNWADGDAAPKTFTVPVINTASPQLPRQFKVTLGTPTGGALIGGTSSSAVLIEDPAATLDPAWSQAVLGTLTDSSPAVSAEGTLGAATIGGGGVTAGATSDHGRFIYQSSTGDGVLTVFVPTPTPAQAAARFAVMVRETLGNDSRMIAAVTSGDPVNYGAKHAARSATAGGVTIFPTTHNNQSTPRWLRLTRAGNSFTTEASADGATWAKLSSITLATMPATVNWGIFHCSAPLAPATGLGDYQLATFESISFGPPPIPAMPVGLSTLVFGLDQVILFWTVDSFAAGYRVERRTETGSFVQIAAVPTQNFYNDFAIAADSGYEYRVQAYNSSGDSPWSAGKRATTPSADELLPTRPSFLTATPGAGSSLDLQWLDNSADETGFPLERRAANSQFAPLQTLAPNTVAFNDSTTLPGLIYEYRLRATNANGHSAWTPIASATAPGSATGYQQWLLANGLPMDESGQGSATATPASDGLPNLIKYALGLLPAQNGDDGRLSYGTINEGGNDYLTFTYTRPEPAPAGITYAVQASPELTAPGWSSAGLVEISSTVNAGLRTITVRDSTPMTGAPTHFMRLQITQQ